MAEDTDPESRTEEATPRRREEAKRQGRVPFSAELVNGLVLLAGVLGLMSFGPQVGEAMLDLFRYDLARAYHPELGPEETSELFQRAAGKLLVALAPLFGILVAVGIATSLVQVGFDINTEKLEPNFNRLNPATGWKRLFSGAAVVRGGLAILKVIALGVVAYLIVERYAGVILNLNTGRVTGGAAAAWVVVIRLAVWLSAAVALVAVLDYIYQRRKFEQSIRMTKQELKDEMKQEEGDPQIKARIRQIQRDRLRRKMLAEVPKATVVITNPAHYAVALRYRSEQDAAPVVVAKAMGPLARRITEIARGAGVPILERPTIARALYASVKEGQPIPQALFRAVAEVLAFVYQLPRYADTASRSP